MSKGRSVNRWLLGARPRTLPAAVVPVAVGSACAVGVVDSFQWWRAAAAMIVAVSLQVATNYVNDYADGQRGSDDDRVGPVRLVGSGLASSKEVKLAALIAFAIAGVAGAALAFTVGSELFIVGAASMLAGWAYTGGPKPYGYLGLGEVFVFVFFGVVATAGSGYVQTESITELMVVASIPVGLLSVALLVINNLRDIPGDTRSGKRTLAVTLGDTMTRKLYVALFVIVGVTIIGCGLFRPPALLGLGGLAFAIGPIRSVLSGSKNRELIPVLGQTGKTQLMTGVLLALGLAIGG